jgi:Holliday junction resolvase
LHGAAIHSIKSDAASFENLIARKLSAYGSVNQLVKTKRGMADIIFERKNKKVAVEVKNFKSHEISISQVNQLNKYVEDIGGEFGFLICLRKPKRDTFLMGNNRLFILTESELSKIPEIID